MRECELNLIPADIIQHEVVKERGKFWIFIAIGFLIFLFFVNILAKVINNFIYQDIEAITSTGEKVTREMTEMQQLNMKEKELLTVKDKMQYISHKGPVTGVFSAIDKAINDNITLTYLEIRYDYPYNSPQPSKAEGPALSKVKGVKGYFTSSLPAKDLRGQAIEKNSLILRGFASSNTDLASMLSQLSKSPLYTSVNLKYSKMGESIKGKPVIFEIECRIGGLFG